MENKYCILILSILCLNACSSSLGTFSSKDQPSVPDYSLEENWSSLPFREDAADYHAKTEKWISDSLKNVDVFYIHPTMYRKGNTWNADIQDTKLNESVDNRPVKFQASVFNKVGRVYAPRYRQAILDSFYGDKENGELALEFAYQDVKMAFEYYLENYHQNRPIIIASHSQGTTHAIQLLKDFFDNTEMKKKLVAAYIIGMGVYPKDYVILTPCKGPKETSCYITWSSYKTDFMPDSNSVLLGNIQTNPISWTTKEGSLETEGSGFLLNINRKKPFRSSAQIKNNYLWVKTNAPLFRKRKVLHVVDYNLFWFNIRDNVQLRVSEYFSR